MTAFKWVLGFLKKYKGRFISGLIGVLAVAVLNMVNPYITGKIVDDVIGLKHTQELLTLLVIMMVVTFVKCIIRYYYLVSFESVSQRTVVDIRRKIYTHVHGLDFKFFDTNRTGDIMARMTGDLEAVRHFTAFTIYAVLENVALFLFASIMLIRINWLLAIIMISITPILTYCGRKFTKEGEPYFKSVREQYSKLNTAVQENISGNRVVKAFTQESFEIEKFTKENEAYRDKNIRVSKVWAKYLPVMDSVASLQSVLLIIIGGIMVINNPAEFTLGELVMFNSYLWAINNPLRMAGWILSDLQWFFASVDKILNMIKVKPQVKNSKNAIIKEHFNGDVEFKNVSFSYGKEQILSNINMKIKSGQKIAFVGPTGSGKSTIISLMMRFYDATSGEVFVDGVNVKDYDLQSLRKAVTVAMQDIFLFSDTIEGNISYSNPNAEMADILRVSKDASAIDFINETPEKFDTIIGERGVGLSGGQKQRIALSRALIKESPILVLDDTTSAVDMETEQEIQKALKENYPNQTTFIIAHRISSVKNCDKIFVIKDGVISEEGKHQELLDKRGYYYEVFQNQTGDLLS